ncbi:hypothetical protein [Haloarcula sediminis]|uniref:hypothetical protein n=1 Tax=Haloarcula sediminis TaxID=3111777 RepID=UPI002D797F9B|nr:hypothetical protein [Haloarcula sp. CK38]
MNISVDRFERNDGSGLEDRPSYVSDAIAIKRKVGWRSGLPLVPAGGSDDQDLQLGDDVSERYEHYPRGNDLLLPEHGSFLRSLAAAGETRGISDMAAELNTDQETVRKAVDLHQIELPSESQDGEEAEGGDIELPSGETVPFEWDHALVLASLLSDGLSYAEAGRYLDNQVSDHVTFDDVRDAVGEAFGGDETPMTPRGDATTASAYGGYASSPWG